MLSPGVRLGRYEVLSPLGAGGMGEVYRARDTELDRRVALKVIPEDVASDPDRLKRFEREARATAALSHPNVLTVFDVGREDGRAYIVFELLEGSTLGTRLARGPLSAHEALAYAVQIARGLAAAHARGIVHRDLKPDNLFLSTTGVVKVLDFGLARVRPAGERNTTASDVTGPGTVMGTVNYMAPEQAKGHPGDARSDIFALGTVLYEMLSGRHPFKRDSSAETLTAILRDEPEDLGTLAGAVPTAVERLVRRCLSKRPEDRFQTANDLALALEMLAEPERSPMAPAAVHEPRDVRKRAARAGRSTFGLAARLSASALFLMAVASTLWLARPREPRVTGPETLLRVRELNIQDVKSDGRDVYFVTITPDGADRLMVMPLGGHEAREIPLPWQTTTKLYLHGIRGSPPALLLGKDGRLWQLPLPRGVPSRVGTMEDAFYGAAWSHRGDRLAYVSVGATVDALVVTDADGRNSRRLTELPKRPGEADKLDLVGWAPRDDRVRYGRVDGSNFGARFFDVAPEGSGATEVFLPPDTFWQLDWTRDGRHALAYGPKGLFTMPERNRWLWSRLGPVPIAGSASIYWAHFTPDGRHLVAALNRPGTEVVRLDPRKQSFTLLLDGAQAHVAEFSPDGSRVAWASVDGPLPDGLWLSRPDGTDRRQLADRRMSEFYPIRWSPDGGRIAFSAWDEQTRRFRIYLARVAEGGMEPLAPNDPSRAQLDPCWSPGGDWLAFAANEGPSPRTPDTEVYLRRVDMKTRAVTRLAGSEGLSAPRCSREGRILAYDGSRTGAESGSAATPRARGRSYFKLFDPIDGRWTAFSIARGRLNYPSWSRDGRHVYATAQGPRAVVRFDVATRRLETVFDLEGVLAGVWMGLDPNDAPLVHRDVSQHEVVRLEWDGG